MNGIKRSLLRATSLAGALGIGLCAPFFPIANLHAQSTSQEQKPAAAASRDASPAGVLWGEAPAPPRGEGEAARPAGESGQANGPPGAQPGVEDPALPAPTGTQATGLEPALPAINAAVRFVLEARSGRPDPLGLLGRGELEAIAAFYTARNFAPIWWSSGGLTPEAGPVIERLRRAADDGLDLKGIRLGFSPSTDQEIAAADVALAEAAVAYGRQASGSRVDPQAISRLIGVEPEVADPAVILALVSTAGERAGDELRGFNPPQKGYLALREKLLELRRGRGIAGRDLRRTRLSIEGRSGAQQPEENEKQMGNEAGARAAGAKLLKPNGLKASGKVAAHPVSARSSNETSRIEAEIIANMERWRWMPRDLGERRIEVNIPDYEAAVIDDGEVAARTRVIVGKEQTPTPIFSETMRYLIVNPYWNVPPSILRKEMLPKLAADPDYFRRLGYEVFHRAGRLVVRQPPGERNALGRIKFVFPNNFSVYMHDTPMHHLFAAQKRAFSHGCVRVDEPFRFAETVLGRANGWSEQRVRKLIGGKERYVYLPKPLPVHIEYFTTYVDGAGRLQMRGDVYGYSRRVREALGLES